MRIWTVVSRAALAGAVALTCTPAALDAQQRLEDVVAALEWREIGPAVMGGRIADIAVDEADPAVFYVGTASGGLWRTSNHGTSWEPLFDDQPTASIGAVSLARSNPNIVWVGTGEPQNRQSSPWGAGVFKSVDGGRSWRHVGLTETRHIGRIAIHPTNPDVVYVAAVGHLWGPNEERGVYKTTDGGRSWTRVLYVDANTGAIDLVMDPGDSETLFAAMYQRRRTAWGFNGGGPGSGIYRTLDGGATWQRLARGLPDGQMGRIGLDVYRRDGNSVYAVVEAQPPKRGVYRSGDRGESWEQLSDWNPRPMYFSLIRIDPNNPQRIYLGGVSLSISEDGGRTWNRNAADEVHSDHHALWIDPGNSKHVIMGSDGGVSTSFDGGKRWRMYDNLPIGQLYEIGLDMRDPYYVCGGLQDNGSWCGPSRTLSNQGIRNADWYNIWGGDGFYVRIDPTDPTVVFAESQNGNVGRLDLTSMERLRVRPEPPRPPEEEGEQRPTGYRWNWNTPIVMSAHDAATIYAGANVLLKSTDRGVSWKEVSPDLTKRIDRSKLEIMGRRPSDDMLSRNDGVSSYGNLTTIAESPLNPNVLYVGTDDGNLQGTRDGGATWADLTPRIRDLPERTYVSRVVASAHAEGTVYATFDGHYHDDYRPFVYASTDFGRNWRKITAGLPDWSVNVIAEHPRSPTLLFVGNEVGVYFSLDRGERWVRLKNNLPTVPVDDINIHPRENDLVLGTHGRSIWILDDVTPLERLSDEVLARAAHLFAPRPAMTYNEHSPQGWTPGAYAAPNPPRGTRIRYYLRTAAPTAVAQGSDDGDEANGAPKVRLLVKDAAGRVIRTLEGSGAAGIQEVVWDLRHEPPYEPEQGQEGGFRFGGRPRGPRVLPGTYTVELTADGQTVATEAVVEGDRRVRVARADLEARQAALLTLDALARPIYEAGQAVRRLTAQVDDAQKLLGATGAAPDSLREAARDLDRALNAAGRDVNGVRGRRSRLFSELEGWTARPTPEQERELERLWEEATAAVNQVNVLIADRVPAFNRMLNAHGIRPDPGAPVALPRRP